MSAPKELPKELEELQAPARPAEPRKKDESSMLDSLTLGHGLRLEDLVDREALGEVCRSFFALFGIPVRIYAQDGQLLADAVEDQAICRYVQGLREGRAACGATVSAVKGADPGALGEATHPCFTGAMYRIIGLDYDGKRLGRIILGPYLPNEVREVPRSLLRIDPGVDPDQAKALLPKMARVRPETVTRIAKHLQSVLDLILFSGHRALLTSQMHLASVRESYRELQERNQRLSDSFERLKELDRLKSNFLATVSHELRTPLTSILGYGEMLAEGIAGPLNAEQTEFVATIRDKGEQLLSLIKSLLDQSKLESGTLSLKMGDVAIGNVLKDVASTLMPACLRKGVELEVELPPYVPSMRGDAERLRQVFLNLAENAVKFTAAGGLVRLVVETEQSGTAPDDDVGFVLFATRPTAIVARVEDTGIGIPASERGRIFDAFYQVDGSSTREHGGTGLGLSIVKRIVEMHGGSIAVGANPALEGRVDRKSIPPGSRRTGFGSVFTVRFPLP
ncbi:MAG: PocR ligand-binding domain-containing protein [Deltaproteobacteria bacterium]|nr:PocR ligand-binding domain-containing protein [Deltaproteobacteria bacterium]